MMINMLQIVIFEALQSLGEATKLVAARLDQSSTLFQEKLSMPKTFRRLHVLSGVKSRN